MSDLTVDDLASDLERNVAELADKHFLTADDVKTYLRETLYPMLENVVEVIGDHEEDIVSIVEQSDDMLQPQTAGIFAGVILMARELSKELAKRLRPSNAGDQKWKAQLAKVARVCDTAEAKLMEITVQPESDDDYVEQDGDPTEQAPPQAANDEAPADSVQAEG